MTTGTNPMPKNKHIPTPKEYVGPVKDDKSEADYTDGDSPMDLARSAAASVEQQKVLNRLTLLIVPALYLTAAGTVVIAIIATLTWWQNTYGATSPPTPVEIILPECPCPEIQPSPQNATP